MVFIWQRPNAKARRFELYFDETEIFDAFKLLGSNYQPLKLEMRIEVVDGKDMFSVALRNDKEIIKLVHTDLKTCGVREN